MKQTSRRGFLTVAGITTAAGAAAVIAPQASASADEPVLPAGAAGSMLAYIHDVQKGEVTLMIDGHAHVVTDRKLVARLANAFAKAAH